MFSFSDGAIRFARFGSLADPDSNHAHRDIQGPCNFATHEMEEPFATPQYSSDSWRYPTEHQATGVVPQVSCDRVGYFGWRSSRCPLEDIAQDEKLGVFQGPLTLILQQKHRDTNSSRIVIQIGAYCQEKGILLQRYRHRNERCVVRRSFPPP